MTESGDRETILVVDDDPDWRRWVADYLDAHGHRVSTAASVEEALATLRDRAIGLMVLDVLYGRHSARAGVELAEELHRHGEWRGLPIVFISVLPTTEVVRELGARHIPVSPDHIRIFEKPFDFPDFLRSVEEMLSVRRAEGGGDEEDA